VTAKKRMMFLSWLFTLVTVTVAASSFTILGLIFSPDTPSLPQLLGSADVLDVEDIFSVAKDEEPRSVGTCTRK
jgi:hypothetical protein